MILLEKLRDIIISVIFSFHVERIFYFKKRKKKILH